jgi:hypothetical protein
VNVVKVVTLVIINDEIGSILCAAGLIGHLASLVSGDLEELDREVFVCIGKTSDVSIQVLGDVVSSGMLTQIDVSGLQFRTKIEFCECLAAVISLSAQRLDAEYDDEISNMSGIWAAVAFDVCDWSDDDMTFMLLDAAAAAMNRGISAFLTHIPLVLSLTEHESERVSLLAKSIIEQYCLDRSAAEY